MPPSAEGPKASILTLPYRLTNWSHDEVLLAGERGHPSTPQDQPVYPDELSLHLNHPRAWVFFSERMNTGVKSSMSTGTSLVNLTADLKINRFHVHVFCKNSQGSAQKIRPLLPVPLNLLPRNGPCRNRLAGPAWEHIPTPNVGLACVMCLCVE